MTSDLTGVLWSAQRNGFLQAVAELVRKTSQLKIAAVVLTIEKLAVAEIEAAGVIQEDRELLLQALNSARPYQGSSKPITGLPRAVGKEIANENLLVKSEDLSVDIRQVQAAELKGYIKGLSSIARVITDPVALASLLDDAAFDRHSYLSANLQPANIQRAMRAKINAIRTDAGLPARFK
ncbi:hypothetical protein HY78_15675 [Rhizorhabdus wittichii DC-6]|nr:hypothetical protein HY78_15675 [Rhizorhabdus wittichii DC-6]